MRSQYRINGVSDRFVAFPQHTSTYQQTDRDKMNGASSPLPVDDLPPDYGPSRMNLRPCLQCKLDTRDWSSFIPVEGVGIGTGRAREGHGRGMAGENANASASK